MDWREALILGMRWPDLVIMVAVFYTSFALRHAIRDRTPPGLKSARETTFVMVVLGLMFWVLELWLSMVAEIVAALTWGTLWVIARRQKKGDEA